MREAGLLSPQRTEANRSPKLHDGTIIPENIDLLWGTDGTQFGLGNGRLLWLFAVIDHFSCEVLGWRGPGRCLGGVGSGQAGVAEAARGFGA